MTSVIAPDIHQVSWIIRLVILILFVLLLVVVIVVIIVEMIIFAVSVIEAGIFVSIFAVHYISLFAIVPVIVPRSFTSG